MKKQIGVLLMVVPSLFMGAATEEAMPGMSNVNILFIEVDDLNYEYLSSFGSNLVNTPHVDALAEKGVRFENAVAQGMMCAPSRNSLITGLYPHNLGLYNNGDLGALPENIWTFPKGLQAAGYYTSWIGKCHIRPAGNDKNEGMKKYMGFDFVKQTQGRVVLSKNAKKDISYADQDWYLSFLKERGLLDKFLNEYPEISSLPEDAYLDAFFTSEAIDFLEHYHQEKPFFLWLNYSVPHGPNDVSREYHDPFDPEDMPGSTKTDYMVPEDLVKNTKFSDNEDYHRTEQAGHSAMVSFMDKQVGRIVNTLQENGQLENTAIVFFSDQGIMLGDHQRQHKGTLFRQVTNPALIISFPKEFISAKTIYSPVELIDLVNTVLEIAHAPESELTKCRTSKSLLPILKGEKDAVRDIAFAEIDGYVMATDGKFRLIEGEDADLLFDDENDPKNLHNLADEYPETVGMLSQQISEWFRITGDPLPKNTY